MNEIKLKNCPFCGSEVELEDIGEDSNDHYYMIACKNSSCGSSTCFGEVSKDDFICTWNTRKPIYDMADKIEREYLGKPVSEEFESGIIRAIEIVKEGGFVRKGVNMSRLIDADILLERLEKKREECNKEVKENENKSLELYIASARREGVLWAYAEVMSLIKESE